MSFHSYSWILRCKAISRKNWTDCLIAVGTWESHYNYIVSIVRRQFNLNFKQQRLSFISTFLAEWITQEFNQWLYFTIFSLFLKLADLILLPSRLVSGLITDLAFQANRLPRTPHDLPDSPSQKLITTSGSSVAQNALIYLVIVSTQAYYYSLLLVDGCNGK